MNKGKLKRIMKEQGCSMIEAKDHYEDYSKAYNYDLKAQAQDWFDPIGAANEPYVDARVMIHMEYLGLKTTVCTTDEEVRAALKVVSEYTDVEQTYWWKWFTELMPKLDKALTKGLADGATEPAALCVSERNGQPVTVTITWSEFLNDCVMYAALAAILHSKPIHILDESSVEELRADGKSHCTLPNKNDFEVLNASHFVGPESTGARR